MSAIKATVVITTRDRGQLLDRAVRSALAQTIQDIEILVVDDGSKTAPSITPHERIRLIRMNESRGPCAARNVGLQAAKGEWITFLDDDDQLLPKMLETSLSAAEQSSLPRPVATLSALRMVNNDAQEIAVNLPVTSTRGRRYFLEEIDDTRSFVTHLTLVAPTQVLHDIGGWDESLPAWEHDDLFLRLNAACSLQGIDDVTYVKTEHGTTQLSRKALLLAEGMRKTERKHRYVFRTYRRGHARYLRAMGIYFLRGGAWGSAVMASTRSLLRDPTYSKAYYHWLQCAAGPAVLRFYQLTRQRASKVEVQQ